MQSLVREITIRYRNKKTGLKQQIKRSEEAVQVLRSIYPKEDMEIRERFVVLYLDRANKVLGYLTISIGSTNGCLVDAKLIFSVALQCVCSFIILSHCHPSGNLCPSNADNSLTAKLCEAAKLLDLTIFDHIILTTEGYYSYADEGHGSLR